MRLNKKKRKIETRYLVLIIIMAITIFIGILSITVNDNRNLTPIEGGPKDIFVMIEDVIYAPFRYIGDKINEFKDMKKIYRQYKTIADKEEGLLLLEEENKELKNEINQMKSLLDLNSLLTQYWSINATVINRDIGEWYNTFTIDKGSKSGIKVDMAVINSQGLIGRVVKTTSYTSEIKLISTNDLNSRISVGIVADDNTTYGILSGYDYKKKLLLVNSITDASKIKKGDKVITSGLSNIFPKGLIIGKVDSVTNTEFGLSKTIKIKPVANFNDIRFVTVIKRKD